MMKVIAFRASSLPVASLITLQTPFATLLWLVVTGTFRVPWSLTPARAAHSSTTIPGKVLFIGRLIKLHAGISLQHTTHLASLTAVPSIYSHITLNTQPFPLPNILHTPSSQPMFFFYRSSVALSRKFQRLRLPPPSPTLNKLRRNGRKGLRLILT